MVGRAVDLVEAVCAVAARAAGTSRTKQKAWSGCASYTDTAPPESGIVPGMDGYACARESHRAQCGTTAHGLWVDVPSGRFLEALRRWSSE